MSSLPLAFAPVPFDADPGGAYTDTLFQSGPFVSGSALFTVPGEYYYYPLSLYLVNTTGAAVANRSVSLSVLDVNNRQQIRQPVTGVQPQNTVYTYLWDITTGAGYSDGTTHFAAPLPPRLWVPGFQIGIGVANVQGGDSFDMSLGLIIVPRRKATNPRGEGLAATPLVA